MIEIIPTEGIAIMFRQHRRTVALCCVLSILGTLAVSATCSAATIIGAPVALSTLIQPGGTMTVGDKTFTNFTYNFTGDMPIPVNVNVIPITDDAGNFGIRFQGAFIDVTGSQNGSDALVTYTVTAGPGRLISDAHLEGNPTRLGTLGSMSVFETFLPLGAQGQNTMKIYDDQNLGTKLIDNTIFTTPVKSLNVQKDILGLAKVNPNSPETPQTVTLSFVDQTFSQVPEPAAALILLSGVAAFGLVRRRMG